LTSAADGNDTCNKKAASGQKAFSSLSDFERKGETILKNLSSSSLRMEMSFEIRHITLCKKRSNRLEMWLLVAPKNPNKKLENTSV
jgi:hypothetical protein